MYISADPTGVEADPRGWVDQWVPAVTRSIRHGGNHKYAWGIERWSRRRLPKSLPYPKLTGLPLLDQLAAA